MPEEEIKEWDDALLDLINRGFIEIIQLPDGKKAFKLSEHI
jgi:hypothetical protein